jgi:beta-1,4-mannosyl-glycoprotein beta-1,4-N-acetylglucosaminyltransferase
MRKLIDCFTFFNELDLLEIRLQYLYNVVDYFVIVEADTTHSGNLKNFNFQVARERFAPFDDKIIYVPIKMKFFKEQKKVAWKREGYQRNCIEKGLKELNPDPHDLILISDLDEIPDKKVLENLKNNYSKKQNKEIKKNSDLHNILRASPGIFLRTVHKLLEREISKVPLKLFYYSLIKKYSPPVNFNMHNYYYYVNYKKKNYLWPGLQCLEAKWIKVFSANEIREFRFTPLKSIDNSGWHFSFLGGKERIKMKLKNFAHQEFNTPKMLSDEYIDFCINKGYSLFDYYRNPHIKSSFEKKEITEFPPDLQKIIVPYKHFILQ